MTWPICAGVKSSAEAASRLRRIISRSVSTIAGPRFVTTTTAVSRTAAAVISADCGI